MGNSCFLFLLKVMVVTATIRAVEHHKSGL